MRRVAIAQSELLNDGFALEQQDLTSHVFPARPTIPVALALAVGLWAGSAATLTLAMQAEAIACIAAALVNGIAASALLLLWWRKTKTRACLMLAIGLLAGGALRMRKAATLHVQQAAAEKIFRPPFPLLRLQTAQAALLEHRAWRALPPRALQHRLWRRYRFLKIRQR